LPTILMEIDPQAKMAVKTSYIYANSQIMALRETKEKTNEKVKIENNNSWLSRMA